jgi:hypothetical protein
LLEVQKQKEKEEQQNISTEAPPNKEEATKEPADYNDIIKGKSIKFIMNQKYTRAYLKFLRACIRCIFNLIEKHILFFSCFFLTINLNKK